jgi:putative copper resistance protein D
MLDALAAAVRALLYSGLLSCAGAVLAIATLPGVPLLALHASRLIRIGAWLTIGASLVSAVVLFFQLGAGYDTPTLLAVFGSGRGAELCLQVVGAAMLLAMPVDEPTTSGIRISNALLLTASLAISGHAIAEGLLNALVVVVHASAAAWWIGSLMLMRHAWSHASTPVFAATVRDFSVWALRIVGALVVAGVLLIVMLVDFAERPFLTPYVKLLLAKLLLAATVLGLAAVNRRDLTAPVLAGDERAAAALCRRIDVELALIAMLLIVTAILTSWTSPDGP